MGFQFADQYTLLHFAVGIITYFWDINLFYLIIGHTTFELSENTDIGIHFINTYFKLWPGGKDIADNKINMLGDTIAVACGWYLAYTLDRYGEERGWYTKHIK